MATITVALTADNAPIEAISVGVSDSRIVRMRERARQMRRVADMAHNPAMIEILLRMADEADVDARELQAELELQIQRLPPQT